LQLLIDTHVLLWAADAPEKLSDEARDAIEDAANDVFVSTAAAFEIVIKFGKGKLVLPIEPALFLPSRLHALGFRALPLSLEHALALTGLPDIHADPFDRMMIAQASVEGMTLVTRDAQIRRYNNVRTLLA
jgi:PIN domain nuclease of toxin-antitoxin system